MYTDMFEVQDSNGIIHSGTEEEMRIAFDTMNNPNEATTINKDIWLTEWNGDLKLVQIHNII